MYIEYELKVLDIDVEEVREKLSNLGASYLGKKFFRRYTYDMHPPQPAKWIRLRTDGSVSTLTYKHILDPDAIDGVKEWEFEVWDFVVANQFLEQIGYKAKSYQENMRESYVFMDCAVEIDSRPLIPSYLEIEGNSEEEVLKALQVLGLDRSDYTSQNTIQIYERYGICGMDQFPYLAFDYVIKK